VRLEVTTEDRPVDMVEEGYDLVIRVNPAPDESLVGRPSCVIGWSSSPAPILAGPRMASPFRPWCAGPATGRGLGRSRPPTDDRRIAVESGPAPVVADHGPRRGAGGRRRRASADLAGQHDLAAGRLAHWGDVDGPEIALWTLYPSRRLLSARVSAFLDHLKEAFPKGTPDELAAYIGG
jgi:DNA-binding transcriptional LysR family regulator